MENEPLVKAFQRSYAGNRHRAKFLIQALLNNWEPGWSKSQHGQPCL